MRIRVAVILALTTACNTNQLAPIDHRGTAAVPAPRAGAAAVYNPANGTVVMFGGADRSGVSDETWTWDGQVWRRQHPASSPPAREFEYMGFDPAISKVVIFGGMTCSPPALDEPIGCDYQKSSTILSDTWTWDGSAWTALKPAHVPQIPYFSADFGGMAGDVGRSNLILVTYGAPAPDHLVQTWTLEGGDWKQLHPSHSLGAAEFSGPAYDAVSGRIMIQQQSDHPGAPDATWSWDGSDWRYLPLSLKTPHSYGRLVSVGKRGLVLVWANNMYLWTGSSWTDVQQVPEAVSPSLRPRDQWAAAYHEPTQQLVLVGGRNFGGNHLYAGTAGWDGSRWVTLVPAPPSPTPALNACSAKQANSGTGTGPVYDNSPTKFLELDFFEPLAGPCHLHVNVVLALANPDGSLLPIAGNPSIQLVDANLTWDAGGQAVIFTGTGLCALPRGAVATLTADDFSFSTPFLIGDSCQPLSAAPSIKPSVVATGLRP